MSPGPGPSYVKQEEWKSTGTEDVMVFYPTLEEMKDFSAFIHKCEQAGAHKKSGICKIVPPPEWSPRPISGRDYKDVDDYLIKAPVKETITSSLFGGAFVKENKVYRKELSVKQFRELAHSPQYSIPRPDYTILEVERQYWRTLCMGEPIYGADTPGSLYDSCVEEFNITKLNTMLDLLKDVNLKIPGVNTPYLYFGMYKTTFSWHTEDMDLYSINYLHFGEPKFWYAIPSDDSEKFERLMAQKFPEDAQRCKAFLRHKTFIVSPKELRNYGLRYGNMVQYPGEFVITFPRGYHMGFNLGFNCAESTNFAIERWIDFGKETTVCKCVKGSVEIDMVPFMKKYRSEEFDKWYHYWYSPRLVVKKTSKSKLTPAVVPSVTLPAVNPDRLDNFENNLTDMRQAMHFLWQHQQDFKEEAAYNKKQGDIYPFCAICQYFVPLDNILKDRPERSRRYTADQLYSKDASKEVKATLNESKLFQCKRCSIVVHECCYPVTQQFYDASDDNEDSPAKKRRAEKAGWLCKRCDFAREQLVCASVNCSLCPLRGGALIPYFTGRKELGQFVHVVCAIMNRKTKIIMDAAQNEFYAVSAYEGLEKDPVKYRQALSLPEEYSQYELDLYTKIDEGSAAICSFCLQPLITCFVKCQPCLDSEGKGIYFHATCALYAKVHFELRHFPYLALAVCPLHSAENKPDDKYPINVGDDVVYFSNNDCDRVVIESMVEEYYYFVEFFDCSFSSDVIITDLIDCECKHVGCNGDHISGYLVTVRWETNSLYQGYFREKITGTTFTVRSLRKDRTWTCSRDTLYRRDETKPPEVEKALDTVFITV